MDDHMTQSMLAVFGFFFFVFLLGFLIVVFSRYFEAVRCLKRIADAAEEQAAILRRLYPVPPPAAAKKETAPAPSA